MATQLKKQVCTAGGYDYTSLEACMNANEQDLTAADKYFDVEILGDCSADDTSICSIHNYPTDATRYINIYTTGTARHAGKWDTTKYVLDASSYIIRIYNSYVTIDGLQIESTLGGHYRAAIYPSANSLIITLKNNIIRTTDDYALSGAVMTDYSSGTLTAYNNVLYSTTGGYSNGFYTQGTYTYNLYNNTVYGFGKGYYRGGGTMLCKNCIGYNNTTDYSGTFDANCTNNLAKDATTPEYGTYYDSKTLTFVDVANGDFHLASTDSDAIDKGADLNATIGYPDIDGVNRSGTWDIGADEYVASATTRAFVFRRTRRYNS